MENKLFLNVGLTNKNEMDYYRALARNKAIQHEPVTSEEWQNLYERLLDTDIRPVNNRLPDLSQLIETSKSKQTQSNVVAIGIMDLEVIYLTHKKLLDN